MPLCHQNQVATPGKTRSSRGRRTLSTRLHVVSMSRAFESLVRAWANPCTVRGRLSLLMMTRPKSSKAYSIGSISKEQVGHGISTSPYASRNSFTAAAIYYMGKHCRLATECCFQVLPWCGRQKFSRMSSYMKALTFPSGATNYVFPPL